MSGSNAPVRNRNANESFTSQNGGSDEAPPVGDSATAHSHAWLYLIVRILAQAGSCILVLDGLERIQDDGARGGVFGQLLDARLANLLRRIASGYLPKTSVLITSRFPLADLDDDLHTGHATHYRPIDIEDIHEPAGIRLLRQRGVKGSDNELTRIVRDCGRHALTVDLAGGWLVEFADGDPNAPLDLTAAADIEEAIHQEPDPRRRAVLRQEHKFARIALRYRESLFQSDPAALALLERVCLFRLGVTPEMLARIFTGQGKQTVSGPELAAANAEQLESKLRKLEQMRLLEATKRTRGSPKSDLSNLKSDVLYTVHPAVRDGFLRSVDRVVARRAHEAAKRGLITSLGGLPGRDTHPSDPATLDLLEEIIHHTLEAGHAQEAWEIYWNQIGGHSNLGSRLGAYERGERICSVFAGGLTPEMALASEHVPTPAGRRPFESRTPDLPDA